MVSVDESVTVSVNWAGEPVKFTWAGATYAITAKPVRWYDRRQWWAEAGRVQRGIGAQVLEVEMWQVQAELLKVLNASRTAPTPEEIAELERTLRAARMRAAERERQRTAS